MKHSQNSDTLLKKYDIDTYTIIFHYLTHTVSINVRPVYFYSNTT